MIQSKLFKQLRNAGWRGGRSTGGVCLTEWSLEPDPPGVIPPTFSLTVRRSPHPLTVSRVRYLLSFQVHRGTEILRDSRDHTFCPLRWCPNLARTRRRRLVCLFSCSCRFLLSNCRAISCRARANLPWLNNISHGILFVPPRFFSLFSPM